MSEQVKIDKNKKSLNFIPIGTDIVTVLLSATLLSLPIENGLFWPLAFIAFVPLLLRMWTRSYWTIFFLAFATFFLYMFLTLEWLVTYGRMWHVLLVFMNSVSYGVAFVIYFFILRRYKSHFFATVLATIIVLLDFRQTLGFCGLPWPILCHTQWMNLPLIQIASLTGCWGVTFLLVNVNESIAHLIVGGFKKRVLPIAVLPVILIVISGFYAILSLTRPLPETNILATVVQWDKSTGEEWTHEFVTMSFDAYSKMTVEELTSEPDAGAIDDSTEIKRLVIWPETSVPHAVRSQYTMNNIRTLAEQYDATFLVGCLTWFPSESVPLDLSDAWGYTEDPREYNSIVAYEPDRSVIPVYSKIHLVPFGEVIPLKNLVVDWFPEYPWGDEDVSPGTGYHVASTQVGKIGSVICYESFFPQSARNLVLNGAEILVLGSNTSWFGRTRASYQHEWFDVYRAVENGVWFCRAATTGVSSVIDPHGRILDETELFKAEAITVPIGLRSGTTVYTRLGDWLPMLCGVYFILLLLGVFLVREDVTEENVTEPRPSGSG